MSNGNIETTHAVIQAELVRVVAAHKVMMALADERVEKAEQECADWKRQFDILLQERSKP